MRTPWILRRLACELQDHIRVTEHVVETSVWGRQWFTVTRCTRCGWTSRRNEP